MQTCEEDTRTLGVISKVVNTIIKQVTTFGGGSSVEKQVRTNEMNKGQNWLSTSFSTVSAH